MLIGYARVSTIDQNPALQMDALKTRVSVLLCMTDLAHASKLKEHDDNDDFQGTTVRAA